MIHFDAIRLTNTHIQHHLMQQKEYESERIPMRHTLQVNTEDSWKSVVGMMQTMQQNNESIKQIPLEGVTHIIRHCREQLGGRQSKRGPLLHLPTLVFLEPVGRGGAGGLSGA